jgi:hypothetical protein
MEIERPKLNSGTVNVDQALTHLGKRNCTILVSVRGKWKKLLKKVSGQIEPSGDDSDDVGALSRNAIAVADRSCWCIFKG